MLRSYLPSTLRKKPSNHTPVTVSQPSPLQAPLQTPLQSEQNTSKRELNSNFLGGEQNFLALVPLALMLGEVTEDLAVRFGETIGGLLNATFGNIVEMILSIAALRAGLYSVVASSLIGSILSNLLLVLGAYFDVFLSTLCQN